MNHRHLALVILIIGFLLLACVSNTGTPLPSPSNSPRNLEFIAYGSIDCGGMAPLPGCVYQLQEWVGTEGPIAPGNSIKILVMNPRSVDSPDTDSCYGYQIDDGVYGWSEDSLRIRARGEPCDWNPDYLFCVCDPDDYILLIPDAEEPPVPGAATPTTDVATLLFPNGLPKVPIGNENLQTDTFVLMKSAFVDVDNDLSPEQAIAYHVYQSPSNDWSPYQFDGATGVALLSNDGQAVLWQSPLYSTENLGQIVDELQIDLAFQSLQVGTPGLYWTRGGRISGSGKYTTVTGQLLRWDGSQFMAVWESIISSYGQMGTSFGGGSDLTVAFEDVDQDGVVELLTSSIVSARNLSLEPDESTFYDYDYTLHLPGDLIYRWNGQEYALDAIRSDHRTTQLRPAEPVFYAPRARRPVYVDGNLTDFVAAAEYGEETGAWICDEPGESYWGHARFLWDENNFYVGVEIHDDRLVQAYQGDQLYRGDHVEMWFDVDLAQDFNATSISQDDIQIGLSPGNFSTLQPEAVVWLPQELSWRSGEIQIAAVQSERGYHIEAMIPLSLLNLDSTNLVTGEGTVMEVAGWGVNPGHEYWPVAGHIIGFGFIFSDTDTPGTTEKEHFYATPDSVLWAEPLTWGNLMFVAAP